jgi:hypothetical protein
MPPLSAVWKAFSLLHLLGDPIDSMLSLQHTLAVRHAAHGWATETVSKYGLSVSATDLASVFWAFDTLDADADRTPIDILMPLLHLPDFAFAVTEAAADVRNTTVKEAARTYLAMIIYLSTVASAFIHASSSASQCASRPGNRIAFAMLYSWLVPAILLSTFGSRFTTNDACVRAIKRFTRHLKLPETSLLSPGYHSRLMGLKSSRTVSVVRAAPYSGSIYVFRPAKRLVSALLPHFPYPVYMLILSLLPNIISAAFAVALSYSTPTVGLGCRSIAHLTITALWFLSFLMTIALSKLRIATGSYHIKLVYAKDFVIGVGAVLAVAVIYAGAFNSCWCWSNGINGIVARNLHVLLGIDQTLQENAESIYPGLVGGGLATQAIVFVLMWGGGWADKQWWGLTGRKEKRVGQQSAMYRPVVERAESESGVPLVSVNYEHVFKG